MGFEEMEGDYVVPSLLNFDALYTPQDHPARELHDTFFVENPETADLSEYGDKVDHIKETHENGWETGSKGYGGEWSREEAERNVIRTHTTAISAQRLHQIDINEEDLPKKLFIVGRNFRNETVDRTHLAEFYQTDGIVLGKDLNFKNLKGYISTFFEKMGYDKFRLIPSYYPYTEMSVEVQVWDEEDEEWLGMGGAGMFRPEVVKPLLGFEAKVLAWGLGIGRIAAMAAELTDIRELYRNDIEIINETPVWRPDWKNNRGDE
jgi:phenylalanyl-tRNA synthetase alpha chain